MAESAPTLLQRYRRPFPGVGTSGGFQVGIPAVKDPYAQLKGFIGEAGDALKEKRAFDLEMGLAGIDEKVAIGLVTPATDDPFQDNILYKKKFREVASQRLGEDAARVLAAAVPDMITDSMRNFSYGGDHSPAKSLTGTLDQWHKDYVSEVLGVRGQEGFASNPAYLRELDAAKTKAYGLLNNSVQTATVDQLMTEARGKIRNRLSFVRERELVLNPKFLRELRDEFKGYPLLLRGKNSIETLIHQEVKSGAFNILQDPLAGGAGDKNAAWLRALTEVEVLEEKGFARNGKSLSAIVQGAEPSQLTSDATKASALFYARSTGADNLRKSKELAAQQAYFRDYSALSKKEQGKVSFVDLMNNVPFGSMAVAERMWLAAQSDPSEVMKAAMVAKHSLFRLYPTPDSRDLFFADNPKFEPYRVEMTKQWEEDEKAFDALRQKRVLTEIQGQNFLKLKDWMLVDPHDYIADFEKKVDGKPGISRWQGLLARTRQSSLLKAADEETTKDQRDGMRAILDPALALGEKTGTEFEELITAYNINEGNAAILRAYHKAALKLEQKSQEKEQKTKNQAELEALQNAGIAQLYTPKGQNQLAFSPELFISKLALDHKWDEPTKAWVAEVVKSLDKTAKAALSKKQWDRFLEFLKDKNLHKLTDSKFHEKIGILERREQDLLIQLRAKQDTEHKNLNKEDALRNMRNQGITMWYKDLVSEKGEWNIKRQARIYGLLPVDVAVLEARMKYYRRVEAENRKDAQFETIYLPFVNDQNLGGKGFGEIEKTLRRIDNKELRTAARQEWKTQRSLKLAKDNAEQSQERSNAALKEYARLAAFENQDKLLAEDLENLAVDHALSTPEGAQSLITLVQLKGRIQVQQAAAEVTRQRQVADSRISLISGNNKTSKSILLLTELTEKFRTDNYLTLEEFENLKILKTQVTEEFEGKAALSKEGRGSATKLLSLSNLPPDELLKEDVESLFQNKKLNEADAQKAMQLQSKAREFVRVRTIEAGKVRVGFWKQKYEEDIELLVATDVKVLEDHLGAETKEFAAVLALKTKELEKRGRSDAEAAADQALWNLQRSDDIEGWSVKELQDAFPVTGDGALESNAKRQKDAQAHIKSVIEGHREIARANLKALGVKGIQRLTNSYYRRINEIRADEDLDFDQQIEQIEGLYLGFYTGLQGAKQYTPLLAHATAKIAEIKELQKAEHPTYTKEWRPHVTRKFNEIVKYPYDRLAFVTTEFPNQKQLINKLQIEVMKGRDLTQTHQSFRELFAKEQEKAPEERMDLDAMMEKLEVYLRQAQEQVSERVKPFIGVALVKPEALGAGFDQELFKVKIGVQNNPGGDGFIDVRTGEELENNQAYFIFLHKWLRTTPRQTAP